MYTLLLPLMHTNTNFYIAPSTLKFYFVELVIPTIEGETDMLFSFCLELLQKKMNASEGSIVVYIKEKIQKAHMGYHLVVMGLPWE
jgi:hypothetical protein